MLLEPYPARTFLRLGGSFCARDLDFGFPLFDARCLASQVAQIVELRATNASATDHLDLGDHRAVERKNALDSDAVGDLADRERLAHAATALGDAHAFKSLDSFLVALTHANV